MNQSRPESEQEVSAGRATLLRLMLALILLVVLVVVYRSLDLGRFTDREQFGAQLAALRSWQLQAGWLGATEFALAGVTMIVLNVPCVLVVLAAAALYGALGGIVMGVLTLNVASLII
jgi:uncharacterized membrane protein YdjX (TVP38/TMEM64 family)